MSEPAIGRLNPGYVTVGDGSVVVREVDKGGSGTIHFQTACYCVCINLPSSPIKWLSKQKCADAIIFEFSADGINLHLVELKSKMTAGTWVHCKEQFVGAIHNALAIIGVLQIEPPNQVKLHVACNEDAISPEGTTAPSTLKVGLGEPVSSVREWISKQVEIESFPKVPLLVILRDQNGNASASL